MSLLYNAMLMLVPPPQPLETFVENTTGKKYIFIYNRGKGVWEERQVFILSMLIERDIQIKDYLRFLFDINI